MRGHVFLVGFMGCGKSTVGAVLADRLRSPFCDLDELIETDLGKSIAEIFRDSGEEAFRRAESRLLRRVCAAPASVVALGGGVLAAESNRELVRRHGFSVWLRAPLALIEERCQGGEHRPLARDREKLRRLFQDREPFYREADLHVEAAGRTPEEICREIIRGLEA